MTKQNKVSLLVLAACVTAITLTHRPEPESPPRGEPQVYLNGVLAKPGERLHVHDGESITFEPYEEPRTQVIAPYSLIGWDKSFRFPE